MPALRPSKWDDMTHAIDQLKKSPRGTAALHALRRFIEDHALGLDSENSKAIRAILDAAQAAPTTTIDAINATYE